MVTALSWGEEAKLRIYLMGVQVGTATYSTDDADYEGKMVKHSVGRTEIKADMLGTALNLTVNTEEWSDGGKPLRIIVSIDSGGKSNHFDARFMGKVAKVKITNTGNTTERVIQVPTDAPIVDDPLSILLGDKLKVGAEMTFYVIDPNTASFIKNQLKVIGPGKATVLGQVYAATLIEIKDPRAVTRTYISAKGDLVKMEGPLGLEMIPEAIALAGPLKPTKVQPVPDLAAASSMTTTPKLNDPDRLRHLKLRVTGNAPPFPSDEHQTATQEGGAWTVNVHPVELGKSGITISKAAAQNPDWIGPDLYIPSDQPKFITLASEIVGRRGSVDAAAIAVRQWVHKQMKPNAGMGVLRDARDVLESKEGVCRDYAILTATLLRAAKIPARLASGIASFDGRFYYHAWVEYWNGKHWVGLDSVAPRDQISAAHIKLASGTVEQALTFPVSNEMKLEVLQAE